MDEEIVILYFIVTNTFVIVSILLDLYCLKIQKNLQNLLKI